MSCDDCTGDYDCELRPAMNALIEGFRGHWLKRGDEDIWLRCNVVKDALAAFLPQHCMSYNKSKD